MKMSTSNSEKPLRPGIDYYKEIVDCGEIIGIDYNRVTDVKTPTSYCKIHYDRNAAGYMIPYLPKKKAPLEWVHPCIPHMEVLIHTQGALLDEVLSNLLAVSVGFKEDEATLYCLFKEDYSENDADEMSSMETEASCGYLDEKMKFLCVQNCELHPIHNIGDMFAFARKESTISFDKKALFHPILYLRAHPTDLPFPFPTRRVHILLSIQYALLGEIDTNVPDFDTLFL